MAGETSSAPVRPSVTIARTADAFRRTLGGGSIASSVSEPPVATPLTGETAAVLPLAVAEPGQSTIANAEKIDPMSLVNRARERLQASLKKDGTMYIVDKLDDEPELKAKLERLAREEATNDVLKEPAADYDTRLTKAIADKVDVQKKTRLDFKTKHGTFIEGDLGKLDEHGQIVAADGKKTTHNYQVVEALQATDPKLAEEYYRALRMVDESGNESNLVNFRKGYAETAINGGSKKGQAELEAEATEIFNKEAIIPTPIEAAKPEAKAEEKKQESFMSAETLLNEQTVLAHEAINYLQDNYLNEEKKSPLRKKAQKHLAQLFLSLQAEPVMDGGTTNPLLECALFTFKQAFVDPPELKDRFFAFTPTPKYDLSRAVMHIEHPDQVQALNEFAAKGIRPETNEKFDEMLEARAKEITQELDAAATKMIDDEFGDTLKNDPKARDEKIARAKLFKMNEMQARFLNSAREQCRTYFTKKGQTMPPAMERVLRNPVMLVDAVTSLMSASMIAETNERKAYAYLSRADFIKNNADMKELFINNPAKKEMMELILKTFFGDKKHKIEEEIRRYGLEKFFGKKQAGLLATLGPIGIGMALMMALMGAEGILDPENLKAASEAPSQRGG